MEMSYGNWIEWLVAVFIAIAITAPYYEYKILLRVRGAEFKFSLLPIINLILTPLLYLCISIFGVYRLAVHIILSTKHGFKFRSLLNGADVISHLQNRTPIRTVFMVNYKRDSVKPFYDFVKEAMQASFITNLEHDAKMFSTIERSCGYSFILKNEVIFLQCFTQLDKIDSSTEGLLSKAQFSKLLSDKEKMPKDHRGLWHVVVGTQAINWKKHEKSSKLFYPILFKINHVVSDGQHILNAMLELCANINGVETIDPCNPLKRRSSSSKYTKKEKHLSVPKLVDKAIAILRPIFLKCYVALVIPSINFVFAILTTIQPNLSQRPELQYDVFNSLNLEEAPHYVNVVKRIKKRFEGVAFEDVLLVAYTASLTDCYKKRSAAIPECLLAPTAVVAEVEELVSLLAGEMRTGNTKCRNTSVFGVRKLPTMAVAEGTVVSLIKGLEIMKKERKYINGSVELKATKFMRDVFVKLVPEPILQIFLEDMDNFASTISNVAGPTQILRVKGCDLENIVPFTGNGRRMGISVIPSYEGRMQLAFGIDKALISDIKEAQGIVDRTYSYIDMLDKELSDST